ncbi:MAG: hypothetical protein U0263_07505 [Polyangiaceae bacterium]
MSFLSAAKSAGRLVTRPGRTLDQLAASGHLAEASWAVGATAGVWSAFCVWLHRSGHAPSRVLLPIPPGDYYLYQAVGLVPLLFGAWWLLTVVTHALARLLGGSGRLRALGAAAGFAYALPLLGCFVLPDLVVFAAFGFGALGKLVRVTGLVLAAAEWLLVSRAITAAHGLRLRPASAIALVALLVQAAVLGVFLR